jgi:hypothetical protein
MESYTPTARKGWKYFAQQVWLRPKGKRIADRLFSSTRCHEPADGEEVR